MASPRLALGVPYFKLTHRPRIDVVDRPASGRYAERMNRYQFLFMATAATALGIGACAKKDPVLKDVVARIGDEDITRADLIALLKELPPRIQARYATQEGLVHLLEETLDKRAQTAEALKLGLDRDPVVKDKITTYVEQKTAALDQQIAVLKEQRSELAKTAPGDILSAELFDMRVRDYAAPLAEAELRDAYGSWVKERTSADKSFQPPPFEVVRKDLVQELVKKRVREDIRLAAGVTIYAETLNGP